MSTVFFFGIMYAAAYFAGYWHGRNVEHKEIEREWEPRLQYLENIVAATELEEHK